MASAQFAVLMERLRVARDHVAARLTEQAHEKGDKGTAYVEPIEDADHADNKGSCPSAIEDADHADNKSSRPSAEGGLGEYYCSRATFGTTLQRAPERVPGGLIVTQFEPMNMTQDHATGGDHASRHGLPREPENDAAAMSSSSNLEPRPKRHRTGDDQNEPANIQEIASSSDDHHQPEPVGAGSTPATEKTQIERLASIEEFIVQQELEAAGSAESFSERLASIDRFIATHETDLQLEQAIESRELEEAIATLQKLDNARGLAESAEGSRTSRIVYSSHAP
jgi:hypothetical protein